MKFIPMEIDGPMVIEPDVFGDDRGFFMESWNAEKFREGGFDLAFVQDNHSRSARGALRGLHFQDPGPQGKLVRVVSGAIFDVAVDLRPGSASFGRWVGVELSAANKRMFWVPEGFAHGFLSLEDETDMLYKCTAPYRPEHEHVLAWNDPDIAIDWPLGRIDPILSQRDRNGKRLTELAHEGNE
ncbi:MAG TPA: dTDP-4-dehydrorhamnose 3,5-epimerase [Alteraurantiacibacter sp.]|jgi:dTDP-4-dehydrorhamnose 3,5-epimerase